MSELDRLAAAVRAAPGVQAKRELPLVGRLGAGLDGDDAAAIPRGSEHLLICGEAIAPGFVAANPRAAGAAAVVTNVADIRAMGGRPLALVNMLVSPDRGHAEQVLDGVGWAAELLGVEVVGGHLTLGHEPALSASCTGVAARLLRARAARPGDVLLAAICLDGAYLDEQGTFFSSLRTRDAAALRDDGEALVEVAQSGACHAARDISMPGVVGSLLQLIELAGCGATLALDQLPRPPEAALERWLVTFPSFGFLLAAAEPQVEAAIGAFERRGIACRACGRFDESRRLRLARAGEEAVVWDLAIEPFARGGGDVQ